MMPDENPKPDYDELFGPPALSREKKASHESAPKPPMDFDGWLEEFKRTLDRRQSLLNGEGYRYYEGNFHHRGYLWHWDETGNLTISQERLERVAEEDLVATLEYFREHGEMLYLCDLYRQSPIRIMHASTEVLEAVYDSPFIDGCVRVEIARELENRALLAEVKQKEAEFQREVDEWREAQRKMLNRKGHVYLAEADTGHYKIGLSKRPDERIKHFDTKMPVTVEKVHSFPADDSYAAERTLHEWLDEWRGEGEWFDLSDLQVKRIKMITRFEDGDYYCEVPNSDGTEVDWEGLSNVIKQRN